MPKIDGFEEALTNLEAVIARAKGKKVVSAALQQAVDLLGLSWDACHQEVSRHGQRTGQHRHGSCARDRGLLYTG